MNTARIKNEVNHAFNSSSHPKGCILNHDGGKRYSLHWNDHPSGRRNPSSQQVCEIGKHSSQNNVKNDMSFIYSLNS